VILTAHQPAYLPWLGLFDKIARADVFVYLDTVPMESSGYCNRNKIKTAQGWHWLTVPVKREEYQKKPIAKVEIDNTNAWQRKHWMSVQNNYGKARHFMPPFAGFYRLEFHYLAELNLTMLYALCGWLGIDKKIEVASQHDFEGTKSDLVLDMCKKLGATKYIFGAKGRDYAKVEDFEREGIELEFQDYQHPVYPQLHGEFVPNMSVIDLLMNVGPKSLEVLKNKNENISSR